MKEGTLSERIMPFMDRHRSLRPHYESVRGAEQSVRLFITSASRTATSFRKWLDGAVTVERQVTKTLVFNTSKPNVLHTWYEEDEAGVETLLKEGRFPSGITLMTDVSWQEERRPRIPFIGFWTKPENFEDIMKAAMRRETSRLMQPT